MKRYITSLNCEYIVRSVFDTGEIMDKGLDYITKDIANRVMREQWEAGGYRPQDCIESFAFNNVSGMVVYYMMGTYPEPKYQSGKIDGRYDGASLQTEERG